MDTRVCENLSSLYVNQPSSIDGRTKEFGTLDLHCDCILQDVTQDRQIGHIAIEDPNLIKST